jgi:hypothetical protein
MMSGPPSAKAGSAVSNCSCPPPEPPPTDQPCKHSTLKISCSHKGRHVSVSADGLAQSKSHPQNQSVPPPSPLALSEKATLQVVAGYSDAPDKITCDTVIEAVCDYHVDQVFDLDPITVSSDKGSTLIKNTSSELVFNARSYELDGFQKRIWPWNESPRTYQIDTHTHDGVPLTGYVEVFPDIQWTPSIEFTLKVEADGTSDESSIWETISGLFGDDKGKKHAIEVSLDQFSWHYDGVKQSVGTKLKNDIEDIIKWTELALKILQFVLDILANLVHAKIAIESKFTISGKWQWEEIDGTPKVGSSGDVTLDFNPLLKLATSWDVTIAMLRLLSAIPGAAPICQSLIKLKQAGELNKQAYEDVQDKIKEGNGPDFYAGGYITGGITLTVEGEIAFKLQWKKEPAKPSWEGLAPAGSGLWSLEIDLSISGHGTAKALSAAISAGGVLSASAKTAIKADEIAPETTDDGIALGCKLVWEGLKFTFLAKADGNVAWSSAESTPVEYSSTTESGDTVEGGTKTTTSAKGNISQSGAGVEGEKQFEYVPDWAKPVTWNHTSKGEQPLGPLSMF